MMRAGFSLLLAPVGGLLLLVAACGGGGGNEPLGQRVTDPAAVQSSTPLVNPVLYQIRGDVVTTSGGASGTVPANAGGGGGGTGATPSRVNNTYTVASGDTCADIAAKFNISVDDLKKNNRTINADCSNLKIGDILKVQGAATPVPNGPTPKTSGKTYTVQSGDTCGDIAASYGVDVQKLIQANGLDSDCTDLKIGQVLNIPS
jgi:LysM repeat protein